MSPPGNALPPILLLSPGAGRGGAERQMAVLAHQWIAQGRRVIRATWNGPDLIDAYPLPNEVQRVHLRDRSAESGRWRSTLEWIKGIVRFVALLRSRQVGVVVSFSEASNVLAVAVGAVVGTPIVVSIRSNPHRVFELKPHWLPAVRLAYRSASGVVVQSREVADWCREVCGREAIIVPNLLRELPAPSKPAERRREIVCVANLVDKKGQDVLLRAFASLRQDERSGWTLRLVGEGPARTRLEQLRSRLGLDGQVMMDGTSETVEIELARASIFVLSSQTEGFPNALQEAMGMGLACISTDCDYGPRDLIQPGKSGLLTPVDDVTAMAAALSNLMSDDDLRRRLGKEAATVRKTYGASSIMQLWNDALAVSGARGFKRG